MCLLQADASFKRGLIRAADAHSRLGNFSAAIGHLESAQGHLLAQAKLERVLDLQSRHGQVDSAVEQMVVNCSTQYWNSSLPKRSRVLQGCMSKVVRLGMQSSDVVNLTIASPAPSVIS